MAQKILIIDDSEVTLKSLREGLEAAGFEVVTHDHALGTGALALREKPDLVLVDASMPVLGGDQIIVKMRNHPRLRDCAIVLMSAMPAAKLAELAKACGADAYLEKGRIDESLIDRIRLLLARMRYRTPPPAAAAP